MLNLKKTAVAVLALGSSAVFAGTMGPVCSAVNVTVPCESTAWDIGGQALYFQPTIGDNNLMTNFLKASNATTFQYSNFDPQWNWGFQLEGSYHFNTGNDLDLNWYHINNSNNYSFTGLVDPLGGTSTGTASVDPSWNMVNLEFGQHADFGEFKSIRFHGGVEYSRIANDITVATTRTSGAAVVASSRSHDATYNGFGPRVGADLGYDWGNGLGIYAKGAMALLVGSKGFTDSTTIGSTVTTYSASYTAIVPELDSKLGVKYVYAMAQGDLTLDAGWMWINYFDATAYRKVLSSTVSSTDEANFGQQGVYFGLKWLGNVA